VDDTICFKNDKLHRQRRFWNCNYLGCGDVFPHTLHAVGLLLEYPHNSATCHLLLYFKSNTLLWTEGTEMMQSIFISDLSLMHEEQIIHTSLPQMLLHHCKQGTLASFQTFCNQSPRWKGGHFSIVFHALPTFNEKLIYTNTS